MSGHTKEPWVNNRGNIDRRIMACVNACAGMDLGDLENGIPFKQRFALIRADIEAAESKSAKYQQWYDEEEAKVAELKAALDRVRGITVEDIGKIVGIVILENKPILREENGKFELDYNDAFPILTAEIHRLLTERMEGK